MSPQPKYWWGCVPKHCTQDSRVIWQTYLISIDHLELCDPLTLTFLLFLCSCSKSNFASRAFCVSSPNNWNSLPLNIRSSDSLATFQSRLKSYLFAFAYHLQSLTRQRLRFDLDYWHYINFSFTFIHIRGLSGKRKNVTRLELGLGVRYSPLVRQSYALLSETLTRTGLL